MTPLLFECPCTKNAIDTGIHTDKKAIAVSGATTIRLYCPYCRGIHELPIERGRLEEDCGPTDLGELEPANSPVLAIAINELHIPTLKRGLRAERSR